MNLWVLEFREFDPKREGTREALCTLGNGYFATRGAASETFGGSLHYPGTYLAGCYNRLTSRVSNRKVENEDLVNLPNWLPVLVRADGQTWLDASSSVVTEYRQELDLRHGLLERTVCFRDPSGRETRITSRRIVHMTRPHLAVSQTTVTALNWRGDLELLSALDGTVRNRGVKRYRGLNDRHLVPLEAQVADDGILCLQVETNQSHIRIALAARHRLRGADSSAEFVRQWETRPGYLAERMRAAVQPGESVTLEKVVSIYSSRDRAISSAELQAVAAVRRTTGFETLLEEHGRAWEELWGRFDIAISGRDAAGRLPDTLLLRLHLYHLLQVASPNVRHVDAGVPARGLHGEAYRGHVFWDELFILSPLTFRMPDITRTLLMYRWYRLGEAKAAARELGFRGAMFPWQSGSDGREETQELHLNPHSGRWLPDNSRRQRHVNAAIAFNVWHYYQITGDAEFLHFYGAEMLLEIARFWASIAEYVPETDRFEIRQVMGPDEYHDGYPDEEPAGIHNNAYTNVMASWTLRTARAALDHLAADRREELLGNLRIDDQELEHWSRCSRRLRVDFHDRRIISQFQGYERLQEFDWDGYRRRYGNIQRLDRILEAEGESPNRFKLSKQADVLMLFYLFSAEQLSEMFEHLGYEFRPEWIGDNIEYYSRRTSHGSTLSRVVHAWVLSRSDRTGSWALFTEALESDYADIQRGTTEEGVHLGAMAGTIDLIFRCYTGLEVRNGVLWLNPVLPDQLQSLSVGLRFRGRLLKVEVGADRVRIRSSDHEGEALVIGIRDRLVELEPGGVGEFSL